MQIRECTFESSCSCALNYVATILILLIITLIDLKRQFPLMKNCSEHTDLCILVTDVLVTDFIFDAIEKSISL